MYTLVDYIAIVFEIISTILYIFLIARMLISGLPIFRSGFFLIFIACSFSDIVSGFVHAPMRHIGSYMEEAFKMGARNFSVIYKTLYFLSTQTLTTHVLLSLLISLNRCTSVGLPSQHKRLWSTRNTLLSIAFVFAISFATFLFIFWSSDAVIFDERGEKVFVDLEPAYREVIHSIASVVFTVRTVMCLLMSIYTLKKLYQTAGLDQEILSDTERKLCLHAVFLFAGSLIMLYQQGVRSYAAATKDQDLSIWIAGQFAWINDVVIYTNLYSIIFCSSHVRALFPCFTISDKNSAEATLSEQQPQPGAVGNNGNLFSKRR